VCICRVKKRNLPTFPLKMINLRLDINICFVIYFVSNIVRIINSLRLRWTGLLLARIIPGIWEINIYSILHFFIILTCIKSKILTKRILNFI
ncbi:hypothetical protein L9F63_009752, partial [Diploptera punctata]